MKPPLCAILRGLTPEEAPAVGAALFDAGWRMLEVPLNRPQALRCIELLVAIAPADALVGAGTVLEPSDVDAVQAAGGRLIVAPNCDPAVIGRALERGLVTMPGVATPTEALRALRCGAQALKIFPAEVVGPRGLAAIATVLPAGTPLWPVGGITAGGLRPWIEAGAAGFGVGGALYRPQQDIQTLRREAAAFIQAWQQETARLEVSGGRYMP